MSPHYFVFRSKFVNGTCALTLRSESIEIAHRYCLRTPMCGFFF
jgi:hypothetical protein